MDERDNDRARALKGRVGGVTEQEASRSESNN